MTGESKAFWDQLSTEKKTMIAIIKHLSHDYGHGIDYDDFTPKVVDNLKRSPRSIPGLVRGLNSTGLTRSEPIFGSPEARNLWVTEEGQSFIFQNQKLIDDWAKENNIRFLAMRL